MTREKTCKLCNELFEPRAVHQVYCSDECAAEANRRNTRCRDRERHTRRRRPVRGQTELINRISKRSQHIRGACHPERNYWRPKTRGDCSSFERPCPYVGCKHHLYLDVTPKGNIRLNFPDIEPWELEETCALDVADRGGEASEVVGRYMNLSRQHVNHVEGQATEKLSMDDELRQHHDDAEVEADDWRVWPRQLVREVEWEWNELEEIEDWRDA